MDTVIWLRELYPAEIRYLHKRDKAKFINHSGELAIMGPEEYFTVGNCHQQIAPQWVDLGNLGIQDLSTGYEKPTNGKKVRIKHFRNIIDYFLKAVSEFDIPIEEDRYAEHPVIYFNGKNLEVFIEALTYADRCAAEWEANRSLFDRWFGPSYFEANSKEALSMLTGLRRILSATAYIKLKTVISR